VGLPFLCSGSHRSQLEKALDFNAESSETGGRIPAKPSRSL
jgi:hypothetical protein